MTDRRIDPRDIAREFGLKPAPRDASGRYMNPPGSPERGTPVAAFARFALRRGLETFARIPIPEGHIWPRERVLDTLQTIDGEPALTWLGHAAHLVHLDGKRILIDPFLGRFAGPGRFGPARLVPAPIRPEDLPPIDVLLLTHNHYDHLDAGALRSIASRQSPRVIVPTGLGGLLRQFGFGDVTELDWHEHTTIEDLDIVALPAIHWSKRGFRDACRSLWCSYAILSDTHRVHLGGDTAYGSVYTELGRAYGPFDAAVVGIGAYEPRVIMRASHTTPEEAVRLGRDLRANRLIAQHWGTIILSDEDPWEPPERFRRAGLEAGYAADDLWVLAVGETRRLG